MTVIPGQGPKLILRRRRELAVDARGIYDSLKVTKDPDPITRMALPVRSASDVVKGLGLSRDVENSLERAVGDWLRSDNPIQFRGQVTRGLRQMIPNLQVRSEAMRRIAALHREVSPGRRPAPGTEVIQKSMGPEGWHSIPGCDTGLRRQVPGGYVYTFPPADHVPPDDGMSALFSTPIRNHPPDLLWCYQDDEYLKKSGPYIGPRGGKWADPKHTVPWKEANANGGTRLRAAISDSHMENGTNPEDWAWANPEDIAEWSFAGADGLKASAKLAKKAHEAGISPEKLQEKDDDGREFGELYFGGDMPLGEILKTVGGKDVLFSGGWKVGKKHGDGRYIFRVMDSDRDPEITAGQHVGADVGDTRQYRSWTQKPGVFAFPKPSANDVLEVSDLDDLAEELDGVMGRSSDEWIERWEKIEIPHINHALAMDEDEISEAVRSLGKDWIKFSEDSGDTLGYLGDTPVKGKLIAKDVSKKPRDDEDDGFDLIEQEWGNSLEKSAQHKYIKRIPTGKQRPKYRYVYKVQGKGLVTDEHLVEGAKFKAKHVGAIGHFEVLAHDKAKGLVKVKHDESGKVAYIKKQDLTRMLASYHTRTPVPGKEARAEEKLPRTTMADLSRGDWQEVVGFQPTEQGALDLARSLKPDWDYAAIKQPTGYLVVAKQRATKAPGRSTIGSPVKIYLRGEQPAKATYTLMEADDLVASHDPVTFNVRKDYPEGVQEREYHRSKGEQQKVIRIAQDMKPEFLINNNPDGINGTPIITQDGVVLGGNARTLGVQRAYKTEPEESRKYKEHLAANARDYGFKPSDVRGMKNPVLVRRVKVDKKKLGDKHNDRLRLLGRRMNEGLTQGLDPRAEEVALARNFVNHKMLRPLIDGMDEGETLDGYLKSNRSRALVRGLWSAGILDNQNYSQFTYGEDAGSDEGLLNQEGRDRVERILVGRIVDSPTLLDRMNPTQRRALAASSVYILSAQQDGWDIGPKLKRAIQIDQSLQRMEKQFDAVGKPKLALRRFLSGKQTELGGISGMADEVKGDDMLRTLLTIVREKAGTRKMPSDFRGFAIRAKEDAKHNPEITGQSDLFGGAFAAKRMSPVEALDIEFGVSPQAAKAKSEREAAKRAAKRAKKEEPFAASMREPDLVKAVSDNKAVTRAAIYAEMLVDAAIATSSLKGKAMVDGPSIARKVLAELGDAMLKDPELARDQGRSPVDKKTVKGLIEAFVQMRS